VAEQRHPIEIATGDAAAANIASWPANVMLYGPPGSEKTTDVAKAFTKDGRCGCFFIPCEDGALKPILARGMPVPDHVKNPVKTWQDMQDAVAWVMQHRDRYSAICIDTISTFSMYLYREAEEQFKGNKNKFLIPMLMRNCLFLLREWIRSVGLHSVFIAHGMAPEVKEGVFYRGGPLLAPKSMIEQYAGLLDSLIRVDYLDVPGAGRTRVYWTGGEEWPQQLGLLGRPQDAAHWRTKNREGCAAAVVPADLGAFLRARRPAYSGL
jgi:hypothetical protein